jgi:hypothetical protein
MLITGAFCREKSDIWHRRESNLGNDVRYFLFIDLPVRQLLSAANALHSEGSRVRQDKLRVRDRTFAGTVTGRAFMASSLMYPVVRVKVYPGEAYIAPTEDIIHDDS